MHEFRPPQFHLVEQLYLRPPYGATIPNAVISGIAPGRVFVNDETQPKAALVYNGGACKLAGSPDCVAFCDAICRWLMEYQGSDYFILYAFPEAWEAMLDKRLANGATKRRRVDFDLARFKFTLLKCNRVFIPSGYMLQRIDAALMNRIREEVIPYSRNYWKSASDFERHGVGYCLIREGEIVSLCYTCFAWNGHHDIDIMTSEGHQRRGLAFVVAYAFIDHCLSHGLTPNWNCWAKNLPSMTLATELGFVPRIEVTTYHGVAPE